MGPYVHRDLTIKWAIEAGFTPKEAKRIGRANIDLDRKRWVKPWVHFRLFGASLIGRILARIARRRRDFVLLGYGLHAVQDALGHGWILPFMHKSELDDWSKASPATQERIKQASLDILNRHMSI